jgi:hypothetical protein
MSHAVEGADAGSNDVVGSRARHFRVGGFIAVAVAMCVLFFDLHLAWFLAAAVVVLVCSLGGWALERKQKHHGS